jgi:hypothetical protein
MIMEMDKFEVNDAHDNDVLNISNMNTLNNETKHGGNNSMLYFDVRTYGIWEGNVTRSEI